MVKGQSNTTGTGAKPFHRKALGFFEDLLGKWWFPPLCLGVLLSDMELPFDQVVLIVLLYTSTYGKHEVDIARLTNPETHRSEHG